MDATTYNEYASRKVWSPLPKEWPGYGLFPYSPEFAAEVTKFQLQQGLVVDGMLGPETFAKMLAVYCDAGVFEEVMGIDVSRHQGTIDRLEGPYHVGWSAVENAGYKFAIIKATEGSRYPPRYLEGLIRGISETDLLVQYYHFGTPHYAQAGVSPVEDARLEASFYLKTLKSGIAPLPHTIRFASGRQANGWVDLEKVAENLTPEEGYSWLTQFFHDTEVTGGMQMGIYSKSEWLEKEIARFEGFLYRHDGTARPIWVARYGLNDGTMPDPEKYDPNVKVPTVWGSYDIWQGSSRATVPGVEKYCDINMAEITL